MKTILPKRRVHKTPRILVADAYTIGSDKFQSEDAKAFSTYYITARKFLSTVNPSLYNEGDDRMLFFGLQRILDRLFYEPVTMEEIYEADRFLETAKVTSRGITKFWYPRELWVRIVEEFGGRPPIQIMALPEGSVFYPHEPIVQVKNRVKGFGELSAWFESKILQVWAHSERGTQNMHWLQYCYDMVTSLEPDLSEDERWFKASLMLHDFGDRSGMNEMESEDLGMVHCYAFMGTDTFCGAYQAWKNNDEIGPVGVSVNALAHRNVQAFLMEKDCYWNLYNVSDDGEINSMVADCYDFKRAVKDYLLPIAQDASVKQNGKIVVGRPDSGNAKDQVLYICRLALNNGLFTSRVVEYPDGSSRTLYFGTTLKFIEGDGMKFHQMKEINDALIEEGFVPYAWGLYGVGGGLRNELKRDNTGAKYALNNVNGRSVVKFSEVRGKSTLPGPLKVLRSQEAFNEQITIVFEDEPGENAMVEYFDGSRVEKPFGEGQDDDFTSIKQRMMSQWKTYPKTLKNSHNEGYPISQKVLEKREEILKFYSPHGEENQTIKTEEYAVL